MTKKSSEQFKTIINQELEQGQQAFGGCGASINTRGLQLQFQSLLNITAPNYPV